MTNPIRELVIKVSVDADTKGFEQMDDAQEKTGVSTVALGNIIANVTSRLVDAAVAAVKYGAALISDVVAGSTEAADAIAKNADQLAVSGEQLQRLSGAAQRAGTDVSQLDAGIQTLTKGLGDAALKGAGPIVDAFGTIGLEVDEVSKLLEAGDIEDALGLIGDAFNETADSAEKNAALLTVFGGSGARLRPLLEQGSDGIRELGDDVRNVISDEDLDQFEALADANLRLEEEVQNLKNQVAAGLAPALEQIAGQASDWISENEELITQDLPAFLGEVGDALIEVTEFVFDTIESWREFIREIDLAAERFEQDFPEAVSFAQDALALIGQVAEDVGDKVEAVVEFILDAVAKLEGLESTVASIRAGLGLDEEPTAERGAPAFLGGGTDLVAADRLTPDNTAADLEAVISGNFSEQDKNIARASLPIARQRETLEAAEREQQANLAAAAELGQRQAAAAARADRRARTNARREREAARRSGGGGGGGGGGRQPSVEDLIAGAVGVAGGGPARAGGGGTLSGTNLISVDQSVTITNTVDLSVEMPPGLADQGSLEELGGFVAREIQTALDRQARIDLDRISARRNVGGG